MKLPLRVRMTAWYVALLAVVVAALGAFLVVRLRADLTSAIDNGPLRFLSDTAPVSMRETSRTWSIVMSQASVHAAVNAPSVSSLMVTIIDAGSFTGTGPTPSLPISLPLGPFWLPSVTRTECSWLSRRYLTVTTSPGRAALVTL